MDIKNTSNRYGKIAVTLHWVMAILVIGLLALGLYMADLPASMQKLKLYGWHKEFGILVLILVFVRITWRFSNVTPALILPRWEKLAAQGMHWLLYVLMFAMPITGWLMSSSAGIPVSFFGLFVLPNPVSPNPQLMELLQETHEWLGYCFIAAIIAHTLAALKHHFINKDDILRRIF